MSHDGTTLDLDGLQEQQNAVRAGWWPQKGAKKGAKALSVNKRKRVRLDTLEGCATGIQSGAKGRGMFLTPVVVLTFSVVPPRDQRKETKGKQLI